MPERRVRAPLLSAYAAAVVLIPPVALAHDEHGSGGFQGGVAHPFTGLDHLAAMIGVGVLAGLVGGRAAWSLPAAFLVSVAVGAVAGLSGLSGGWLEPAILSSLAALLLLLIVARRAPVASLAAACGAFGFVHGLAHGAEAPGSGSAASYVAGVLLATAALHGVGLLVGTAFKGLRERRLTAAS